VVDVTLPDMRGDVLARRLREEGWGRDLGIVLVSGRTNEELQRLAALSSADAAVTKAEVDSQLLREVIRARRRRHQTSRPGRAVRSGGPTRGGAPEAIGEAIAQVIAQVIAGTRTTDVRAGPR